MKNDGQEYRAVMHDFAQTLFKECADSLALINLDESNEEVRSLNDLFNYPAVLQIRDQINHSDDSKNFSLNIDEWISVYTTLGLYCMSFSQKTLSRFKSEVLAHPELGTDHDIEQLYERVPKARLLLHNLEKRFGHKAPFRRQQEKMIKLGWFKRMDPVPKYTILK